MSATVSPADALRGLGIVSVIATGAGTPDSPYEVYDAYKSHDVARRICDDLNARYVGAGYHVLDVDYSGGAS